MDIKVSGILRSSCCHDDGAAGLALTGGRLKITFREIAAVEPPLEPCVRVSHTEAHLIVSGSCREYFSVVSRHKLSAAYRSGFGFLRQAKRLAGRLVKSIHDKAGAQRA